MGLANKWRLFGRYRRVYSSETYNDTMQAVERVASSSLLLFDRKPTEEQLQIANRVSTLAQRITETATEESPLVVGMALLTALRVHDQMLQRQAGPSSPSRP